MPPQFHALTAKLDQIGAEANNIRQALELSSTQLARIDDSVARIDPDTSLVVFGSLARGEAVEGSDVDWTLLIDGPSRAEHRQVAQEIEKTLRELGMADPRAGGAFGSMAFSHDIVHKIGGQSDTNKNMTQRVLLLLESTATANPLTRSRVFRLVLQRYVQNETSLLTDAGKTYRVPRFLLNDIVRFWRTMAVDYASKRIERAGEGWAIRNAKLRFSRKLLFACGLWMCLSARLSPSKALVDADSVQEIEAALIAHLDSFSDRTPLGVVLECFMEHGDSSLAGAFVSSYDNFVSVLSDPEKRKHLETLEAEQAAGDPLFKTVREASHAFQGSLNALFLERKSELSELVLKYGVF